MRTRTLEMKPDDPATPNLRAFGGAVDRLPGLSRDSSVAKLKADTAEPWSNLPALKALISNHRRLLVNVRRSNELLEHDNVRMERELAARSRQDVAPIEGDDPIASMAIDNANAKLVWIENYIHGTLAQTLWALNARATQLEEQLTSVDQQQQTHRLLEMTHAAYDQLRTVIDRLHGGAHD